MKILQICTVHSLGGLELYFASCCERLTHNGHDVISVVRTGSKLHDRLTKNGIKTFEVDRGTFGNLGKVKKLMGSFKPDIVHIHHKKDLLLGALLKTLTSSPYKYVHTRQMDLPGKKKNVYHSYVYGRIDLLLAITERLKNQIIERININPNKVQTLYYGVPIMKGNRYRCDEVSIQPDVFNIGCVARIDVKKEQHILVEALALLKKEKVSNIHVYLVGGITDQEYHSHILKLIEKHDLEQQITLTGFLDTPQELMNCFDTVVLTTGNETFGLVLPEAMRMEVPVIGANGGGVPEILIDHRTGILFEPGSPASLKKAIIEMMNDSERAQLAKNGKKEADSRFDIDNHFSKLVTLFKN